jgi:hypothetical protein
VLFLGRRVYWVGVVVVAIALHQQRSEGYTARKIMDLFGMTLLTFRRWLAFFRSTFPHTPTWQRLRGLLIPPIAAEAIPLGLLERLRLNRDGPETALVRCLRLLSGCGV